MIVFSVIVPVYNSRQSLFELYWRVCQVMQQLAADFELILVDDFSLDDSYQQIKKLARFDQRVKGIRLAQNFGQQNAIFCGLQQARGDYLVTLDDDLQHSPEDIIKLYAKIKEGYQLVYALPEKRQYKFYRRWGSKLTNFLFGLITSKTSAIRVSSFRIMQKDLAEKIIKTNKHFIYLSALLLEQTDEIANIYTDQSKRKYGESNYNLIKLTLLFGRLYLYYGNLFFLQYLRKKGKQYLIAEATFVYQQERGN